MSLDSLDLTTVYSDAGYPVGMRGEDRTRRQFGGPLVIGGSATAVQAPNNTAENTVATLLIPGGLVTPGAILELRTLWELTNNAGTKTVRLKVNGSTYVNGNLASLATARTRHEIFARGAGQLVMYRGLLNEGTSGAMASGAVDWSADATMTITMQLATGADSAVLQAWGLLLHPNPAGF